MNRLLHFIQYHNAIPIALGIVVIGAGGAYAATNPEEIYSAEQQVLSIDNTYIASKDLAAYSPKVEIVSVTEDAENYYVAYKLSTIDIVEAVWRDVVRAGTLTVSKADLGPYRDLGVYATQQLRQIIDRESQRLVETQEIERRDVSKKIVATAYGGLIGKFLDDKTETLPGYVPVVVPLERPLPLAAGPSGESQTASAAGAAGESYASVIATASGAPIIQVLGNNPSAIPTGSTYADLGAVLFDDKDRNIGLHVFVDGREVIEVQLDTSTSTEYRITYRATDTDSNTTEVFRRVIVYDKTQPPPSVEQIPPMHVPEIRAIEESSGTLPAEEPADTTTPTHEATTSSPETISESSPESDAATSTESATASSSTVSQDFQDALPADTATSTAASTQ